MLLWYSDAVGVDVVHQMEAAAATAAAAAAATAAIPVTNALVTGTKAGSSMALGITYLEKVVISGSSNSSSSSTSSSSSSSSSSSIQNQ